MKSSNGRKGRKMFDASNVMLVCQRYSNSIYKPSKSPRRKESKMFVDWCPLCGKRWQGETPDEVIDQIQKHLEEGKDGKSECKKNWQPFAVALKDDHY